MKWMAVAAATLMPCCACAQQEADWTMLKLSNRSTVYIVDDSGHETAGKLVQLSPHSLTLVAGGIEQRFDAAHVRRIDRRGDSVRNGAVIGAIAGAVMGLAAAAISDCSGPDPGGHCPGQRAAAVAVSTGIYAAAGTIIDACHIGRTTVYVADGRARGGIQPVKTGRTAGELGLRFAW